MRRFLIGLVTAVGFLCGCGDWSTAPVSTGPKAVNTGELPKLGDPIGPLDEDRIKVAGPAGWKVPARSSKWIARFNETASSSYPTIIVTADDYEQIATVTHENVEEFARQSFTALENDGSKAKQTPTVEPIKVGSFVGITYGRRARAKYGDKRIVVEQTVLETVVGRRKYTVELRTRDGDTQEYRPYLLAVAGGIEFLKGETPQPPKEESTQARSEESSQRKPKQKKPKTESEFEVIEDDEL